MTPEFPGGINNYVAVQLLKALTSLVPCVSASQQELGNAGQRLILHMLKAIYSKIGYAK
jgi:hypothetical protein